jgi:nucleoid-associated protein YgaU
MSRYNKRSIGFNNDEQYKNVLDKKGVKKIEQYRTLERDPVEQEDFDSIEVVEYVWRYGDMYWRLSSRFYGSPEHWWVIASFNERPTESLNKVGDVLKIPVSLADALQVVD